MWEELYKASPGAKVILSVRDSDQQWWESVVKFQIAKRSELGNPGYWLIRKMINLGIYGPGFAAGTWIGKIKKYSTPKVHPAVRLK